MHTMALDLAISCVCSWIPASLVGDSNMRSAQLVLFLDPPVAATLFSRVALVMESDVFL